MLIPGEQDHRGTPAVRPRTAAATYPVRVDASLDRQLSRWLWLVKWLQHEAPGRITTTSTGVISSPGTARVRRSTGPGIRPSGQADGNTARLNHAWPYHDKSLIGAAAHAGKERPCLS